MSNNINNFSNVLDMHAHSRQTSKPGPNTDRILEIVNYKHTQCHLFRTSKSQSIHSAIYLQIAKVIIIHLQLAKIKAYTVSSIYNLKKSRNTQCRPFTTGKIKAYTVSANYNCQKSKRAQCHLFTTGNNQNIHSAIYFTNGNIFLLTSGRQK